MDLKYLVCNRHHKKQLSSIKLESFFYISYVNSPIFVELDNTVEGLIRYEKLGDEYFIYNEEKRQAIGERTGKVYQIGDKVKIRVANASKLMRQFDFEICEEKAE